MTEMSCEYIWKVNLCEPQSVYCGAFQNVVY